MNRERIRRRKLLRQKLLGLALLTVTAVMIAVGITTDIFEDGGAEALFFTIPTGIGLLVSNEVVIFD